MKLGETRRGSGAGDPWRAGLWYLIPLSLVTVFLLLAEHRAHVFGRLLYAVAGVAAVVAVVGVLIRRPGNRGGP